MGYYKKNNKSHPADSLHNTKNKKTTIYQTAAGDDRGYSSLSHGKTTTYYIDHHGHRQSMLHHGLDETGHGAADDNLHDATPINSDQPRPKMSMIQPVSNPITVVSGYFEEQCWPFERFGDNEVLLDIAGDWCRYRFYFSWLPERQFFYVTARVDMLLPDVPEQQARDRYSFLLQELNAALRLGHVDMSPEDQRPVWRFMLPLRGSGPLTLGQLADILEEGLQECDKIYPAFQLFVWGGYGADEAVSSVMFPVAGSA